MTESTPLPEIAEPGISSSTKDRLIDALFKKIERLHLQITTLTAPSTNSGYRVTDPEGGTHDYPDAFDAFPNRLDLILTDESGKTIAIFHRWENVERIA